MKLVVGLGNPGLAYKKTRHNLGFMVVDAFLKDFGASLRSDQSDGSACLPDRQGLVSNSQSHQPEGSGLASNSQSHKKSNSLKARLVFKKKDFILCKPLTFMNLSGSAVLKLAVEFKLAPEDILVICDDINLGLGRIKIRAGGSSGGHRGLESISQSLKSRIFARLRIGIAASESREGLSGYVLSPFSHKEQRVIQKSIEKAKEAVLCWLENGVEAAMSNYNRMPAYRLPAGSPHGEAVGRQGRQEGK